MCNSRAFSDFHVYYDTHYNNLVYKMNMEKWSKLYGVIGGKLLRKQYSSLFVLAESKWRAARWRCE